MAEDVFVKSMMEMRWKVGVSVFDFSWVIVDWVLVSMVLVWIVVMI